MEQYVQQLMEALGEAIPEDKKADAQQLMLNAMVEANKGLENNKNEILGKLTKLKKKYEPLDKIDISDYNDLKAAKARLDEFLQQKAQDEGDYKTLIEQLEQKHQLALQALQSQVDNLSAVNTKQSDTLQKTLIDNGLTDALTKANTKTELLDAARALLRNKASLEESDDGNYSALIDGKPMNDFVSEWVSKEGTAFVSAPNNSGAGSVNAKQSGGKMAIEDIAKISNRSERIKLMEEHGY
jgi:hypothetical protein